MNDITAIINFLSQGSIKKALENFIEYTNGTKEANADISRDLMQLNSRLNQLERDSRLGLIDSKTDILERNRITNALLSLLDEAQKKDVDETSNDSESKLKIFISYSHRDISYKEILDKHLKLLKKSNLIETWDDREILPGQDWESEIQKKFDNSDIVLVLISPNLLASDYCYSEEMYAAIEKHNEGNLIIIPILLEFCFWETTPFANIQFLPRNGKPISSFKNSDEAYSSIVSHLQNLIQHRFQESKEIRSKIDKLERKIKGKDIEHNDLETVEALIDYYKKINKQGKVQEYTQIKSRLKFKYNIENPITVNGFHIEGVSIYNDIHWDIQSNINILLGRNGYGKSHLLRLIPCLLRNEKKIMDTDYKLYTQSLLKVEVIQQNEHRLAHYNDCQFIEEVGIVPMLAIPTIRNLHPSKTITPAKDEFSGELCEIGALHFINQLPFDALIQDKLFVLGNQLLKQDKEYTATRNEISQSPIVKLINVVVQELTNSRFEISKIQGYFGQSQIDIQVVTEGNDEPIAIQKASQGTVSVLSMLILIYYYLKSLYPNINENKLLIQKAIVFIDELDAHLHPIWQRKIVGILKRNFPNIQFFITAHSPLIVAGCYEREVSVLRKTENGKFSLHQFNDNFIGVEIDEIYSRIFEIENLEDETFIKFSVENSYKKKSDIIKRGVIQNVVSGGSF